MNYRRVQMLCFALALLAGIQVSARQTTCGDVSSGLQRQKASSIKANLAAATQPASASAGQETGASKAAPQVPAENSKSSSESTSNTAPASKTSQSPAADQESASGKAEAKGQIKKLEQANVPAPKTDPASKPQTEGEAKARGTVMASSPPKPQTEGDAKAKSTVMASSPAKPQTEGDAKAKSTVMMSRPATKSKEYTQFSSKDYSQAPAQYQLELERAQASGDRKAEAAVAFKQARAFDFLSGTDPKLAVKAEAAYKQSIAASLATGDPVQRSTAANNLSVLLLKQGKVSEAGQAITQIDFSSIPKNQQPIFRFNAGRVHELNGNQWEAYNQYSQAFAQNPMLVSALEGSFRTLGKQTTRSENDTAALSERATATGLPDIANEQLLDLLESWDEGRLKANPSGAERLMTALVSAYAAQDLTPLVFRTREVPRLQKISALHGSLTEMIKEIEVAYLGTFPSVPSEAAVGLGAWRANSQSAQSMASMLVHIADFYATNNQPEMALGRYGAGWEIAHAPQCAVKYSSLLSRNPVLDPGNRLADRLVQEIFMEKGQAYLIGDWAHILPLHIALGTIFEERQNWGENGDPRGALFQWQHAIAADAEVHKQNPSTPPSPGLHVHLGNVFRAIGRNEDAVREFLTAGLGFVTAGDLAEARKSAHVILELSPGGLPKEWGSAERSRWEELARVTGVA